MTKTMVSQIIIKPIKEAPVEELKQLYKEAGWWESSYDLHPQFLSFIVKDSAVFVGVFLEKKLIGMGRALSDLVSDAYIQDVTVLKEYRGRGIGKDIIQTLIKILKEKSVDWIGLVAEPGTSPFYEQLGFEPLKGHVALKFKANKNIRIV
jgi:ribosomal protein S18 acetylase RimI-like enzyme